jgi:hypothetical protein
LPRFPRSLCATLTSFASIPGLRRHLTRARVGQSFSRATRKFLLSDTAAFAMRKYVHAMELRTSGNRTQHRVISGDTPAHCGRTRNGKDVRFDAASRPFA